MRTPGLRNSLLATGLVLGLGACAYDMVGLNKATAGIQVVPGQQQLPTLPQFLHRVEKARGQTLGVGERAAIGSLAQATVERLEASHDQLFASLGRSTGVNPAALKLLLPNTVKPMSDEQLLSRLEQKMGRKLSSSDHAQIRQANSQRNQALSAALQGFASDVSSRSGLQLSTVMNLLPILGI